MVAYGSTLKGLSLEGGLLELMESMLRMASSCSTRALSCVQETLDRYTLRQSALHSEKIDKFVSVASLGN